MRPADMDDQQIKNIMIQYMSETMNEIDKASTKYQKVIKANKLITYILLNFDTFYKIFSYHRIVEVIKNKCLDFIIDGQYAFLSQTSSALLSKIIYYDLRDSEGVLL